jgi:hypothetical protein
MKGKFFGKKDDSYEILTEAQMSPDKDGWAFYVVAKRCIDNSVSTQCVDSIKHIESSPLNLSD